MAAIPVEIEPYRRIDGDQVEFVADLDELVESSTCSCNAGDDNPSRSRISGSGVSRVGARTGPGRLASLRRCGCAGTGSTPS